MTAEDVRPGELAAVSGKIESLLRMATPPVAVHFVPAGQAPPRGLLRRSKRLTFCQFVTAAATGGYPLLSTPATLGCPNARIAFGFDDLEHDPGVRERALASHAGRYAHDLPTAGRVVDAKPRIPFGTVAAVAVAPLPRATFLPDAVLLHLLPWQAYHAIDGYLFATGAASLPFEIGTNSLMCAYLAVRAGHQHAINLATACSGGHSFAGMQSTDMVLALPWECVETLATGLERRSREHPYPGMIAMPAPAPLPARHILQPDDDA